MERELVSVIIPCYNNALYLRQCIDSVLGQTYRNIEIIVVDDGSDDNTSEVIVDYITDNKISYYKLEHGGVSKARNVAIELAQGKYIVFIDGDDWVEKDHVETLVNGIGNNDCSMILMCVDKDGSSEINDDIKRLFSEHDIIRKPDFNLLFETYALSSPCNKIYRCDLLKGTNYLRFDTCVSYAEDLLFNLEYFNKIKSVRLINKPTYHYVKHCNISGTKRYHHYISYTLHRLGITSNNLLQKRTQVTDEIIMRHILWGLFNLYHKQSDQTKSQRKAELLTIISSAEWINCHYTLKNCGISTVLKMILAIGNVNIIDTFFSLKFNKQIL